MKKLAGIAIVMTLFVSLFTGLAFAEDNVIEFFFYKDTIVDAMNKMARAFEAEHPGVVIKNQMLSTEYNTVLKTKDAAGKLPDVFAASTPGEMALMPYVEAGKIIDVSHFKVLQNLPEDYLKSITFSDGGRYIVPLLVTARGIIYNERLFEKAGIKEFPRTLDEMKVACQKLKDIGVIPFAAGGKDGWTLGSTILQIGQEVFNGPDFADKMNKGEASFKDNTMKFFEFYDLFLENCQENPLDTDYMGSVVLYVKEEAAMIIQGPWAIDAMVDLDRDLAMKYSRMAPIPFTNDPELNKLYFDFDTYFCVSSKADAELVDEYFDFMINGKGREIFKSDVKVLNPFGITFETHQVNKDILNAVESNNVIGDSLYVNSPDGWWQNNARVMQEYMAGKITKEEMMEILDKDWRAAVN